MCASYPPVITPVLRSPTHFDNHSLLLAAHRMFEFKSFIPFPHHPPRPPAHAQSISSEIRIVIAPTANSNLRKKLPLIALSSVLRGSWSSSRGRRCRTRSTPIAWLYSPIRETSLSYFPSLCPLSKPSPPNLWIKSRPAKQSINRPHLRPYLCSKS